MQSPNSDLRLLLLLQPAHQLQHKYKINKNQLKEFVRAFHLINIEQTEYLSVDALMIAMRGADIEISQQALNEKALTVIRRVRDKLTGQDFSRRGAARLGSISCDVSIQVEMLIAEATSNERLCQCFVGWCPFW